MLVAMAGWTWLWVCALSGCGRMGFDLIAGNGDARAGSDAAHDAHAIGDALVGLGNVQVTPVAAGTDGLTLTIEPTQPGTLLVASFGINSVGTLAVPPGWTVAIMDGAAGACSAILAYQLANPGGITSLTFTLGGNTPLVGSVSEWTGRTALDAMGSIVQGQPNASQSVETSTATTANELAITTFCEDDNNPTYTPGAGWAQLASYSNVASSPSLAIDAQIAPAGIVGESVTSNVSGKYSAVIATFR
jgi:hypothetical protein